MISLAIYFIVSVTVWDINWLPMLADLDLGVRFAISCFFAVIFVLDFMVISDWWDDL